MAHRAERLEYSYASPGYPDGDIPDAACLCEEGGDGVVAYVHDAHFRNEDEMDACGQRLAACWNACGALANPAAVPDLLAACVAVVETDGFVGSGLMRKRIEQVRVAIAKAAASPPQSEGVSGG